ncbi:adenylyltransferase/cytidyltransferase family protein [Aliivibrio fischeri]|uniref:adenylyltransferase/cytidyltransferase family protein n=1 Tax=Aliivibrio fischeri TaxID=668 RepID=UPI003F775452
MKKIGYTTGVYDMFHVGHLNLLRRAKLECDYLIVGITTDELCISHKKKIPIIPFNERMDIVEAISFVDEVVPQNNYNKIEAWETYRFDKMFVGDDWKGTEKWKKIESNFHELGVEIVYFPYTTQTSSSKLREALDKISMM